MINGLITAIRTLTVLPIPGRDAKDLSASLPWFPVVGLMLGSILYGTTLLITDTFNLAWPEATAVLLVLTGTILTRALHLDGLADWADGFWGARDKDNILRIMKDSGIGTFGTAALTCMMLGKWVCLTKLVSAGSPEWIICACIVSRTAQVDLAVAQPYARPEGGTGSQFINNARTAHLVTAILAAATLLFAASAPKWSWLAALAGGLAFSRLFGAWARKKIGGVTGDLLGACSEITETMTLAIGAILC